MSWFSDLFQGRKRAMPGSAMVVQHPQQAVNSPRDYSSFADEGYKKNVVAFRSIERITDALSAVDICMKKKVVGGKQPKDIYDHPVLQLLQRPNPAQAYQGFIKQAFGYFLINGNMYVQAVKDTDKSVGPMELWNLRPDRVQIVPGQFMFPSAYKYKINNQERTFPIDPTNGDGEILQMKSFNPKDDWYGMSAIEAAAFSVDQLNAQGQWNLALLQNSARPSGAFVMKPENGTLSEEQRRHMKVEIDNLYAGSRNSGRPMLLEGGLDWKEMSINPKDMDWINGKHTTARDVCLAFGVPSQLLGIPGDNTYSNYEQAKLAFYLDTVIPLVKFWVGHLNQWLVPAFDDSGSVYLEADINSIDALEPMRAAKWTQVSAATFLSFNEKREQLGYGRYEGAEDPADMLFIPTSVMPIEDAAAGSVEESDPVDDTEDYTGEEPTTDASDDTTSSAKPLPEGTQRVSDTALNGAQVTALVDVVARVAAGEIPRDAAVEIIMVAFLLTEEEADNLLASAGAGFVPTNPEANTEQQDPEEDVEKDPKKYLTTYLEGKAVRLGSKRSRENYRKRIIAKRQRLSKQFESQLKAVWRQEATNVAEAVKGIEIGNVESAVERGLSKTREQLKQVLNENILRIMKTFGQDVLDVGKLYDHGFETKDKEQAASRFDSYLKTYVERHVGERIRTIDRTSKKRVVAALRKGFQEGVEDGATSNDYVKMVKETYAGFSSGRAATIVRTETSIAQNDSQRAAARALGLPNLKKTWISEMVDRSRHNHMAMHDVAVGVEEKFLVPSDESGSDEMDGPGDPSAPADQVINCHCVNVFGRIGDEEDV